MCDVIEDQHCGLNNNMNDTDHLCEMGGKDFMSKKDYKKLVSGRCRKTDPFKCGCCSSSFTSICVLHAHFKNHCESGSYYFDNYTQTAFPKFDSFCAYTQVEVGDVKVDSQFDTIVSTSVKSTVVDTASPQLDAVRKSNRIASRRETSVLKLLGKRERKKKHSDGTQDIKDKSCSKANPEHQDLLSKLEHPDANKSQTRYIDSKSLKMKNGESVVNKADGHETELSASSLTELQNDSAGEMLSPMEVNHLDKLSDNTAVPDAPTTDTMEYHTCPQTDLQIAKQVTIAAQDNPDATPLEENSITTQSEIHVSAFEALPSDFTHDVQKRDELTASEVLLAMSKGASEMNGSNDQDAQYSNSTHLQFHSEADASNVSEQTCDGNVYDDKVDAAQEQLSTGKKKSEEEKKRVECKVCGKVGSRAMLTYHKYLHMEKKSFTCDKCGSSFQHPNSLQMHLRQHEKQQFCCEICPAAFFRKQYLETHMLKHTGENPHMCDHCGKSYRDPNHLKRHIRHVHENKRNFECDICLEKFFRSDHLKNHRLRHFEADKKCRYCKKMFKHPNDLLRHTMTHTGEKKWHCHLCNHGFVGVSPYYAHMSNKHGVPREEAKQLKPKLQAHRRLYQGFNEVIVFEREEIVEPPLDPGNSLDAADDIPDTASPSFVATLPVDHTELITETSDDKAYSSVDTKVVSEQVHLQTPESLQNVPPVQETLVGQREAGCQTSEYDRTAAAIELVQLQSQSFGVGRPVASQQSEKLYQTDTTIDGKKCFYVYNDLTGVGKDQAEVEAGLDDGIRSDAMGYSVIQAMDMGAASEVEILQESTVSDQGAIQMTTETGDFVMNGQFDGTETVLDTKRAEGSGIVGEARMHVQGLELGPSEGTVLPDGAEMAMMMPGLSGNSMQTVMFLDDNQCASEVVIHVDQIDSL